MPSPSMFRDKKKKKFFGQEDGTTDVGASPLDVQPPLELQKQFEPIGPLLSQPPLPSMATTSKPFTPAEILPKTNSQTPKLPLAGATPVSPATPTAPPTTGIEQLPTGQVKYTVNNKEYLLSAEEYEGLLSGQTGKGGGLMSPQVQEIIKQEQVLRILNKDFKKQDLINRILAELPQQEQNIPEVGALIDQQREAQAAPGEIVNVDTGLGFGFRAPNPELATSAIIPSPEQVTAAKNAILANVAGVYGVLRTGATGQKPIKQAVAEQNLNKATSEIDQMIQGVQQGLFSPNEAIANFELAAAEYVRLEASVKGLGQLNLRYWETEGHEVETMLAVHRSILERQRSELIAAGEAQRIKQATEMAAGVL